MSRLPSRAAWASSSRKSRRVSVNHGGSATGAAVAAPDAEPGRRKRQRSSAGSFIDACRCGSAPKDEVHRANDSLSNLLHFLVGAGGKERPGAALSRDRDVRRDLGDRVYEVRLDRVTDRRAAVKRRRGDKPRAGQPGESREGAAYLGFRVAEIRSQAYEGFRRRCLLIHRKRARRPEARKRVSFRGGAGAAGARPAAAP